MIGLYLYSALVIISIILIGITYWKTKNKLVFVLLLAIAGCIAIFDYIIYVFGKAYIYKPGILNNSYDKQIGAIVSDVFSVPASAVFFAALRLKWRWAVMISILYYGIEELFIKAGIYEQFWWESWYTFILLFPLFWIAKIWYNKLNSIHGHLISYTTLISAQLAVRMVLIILMVGFSESRILISPWIKALGTQGPVIYLPISLIIATTFSILILRKVNKGWIILALAAFFLLDLATRWMKIIESTTVWDNIYIILIDIITLLAGIYFSQFLEKDFYLKRKK